jgi:hypothetical protein
LNKEIVQTLPDLESWIGLGKAKMRKEVSSGSKNMGEIYITYT